VSWGQQRQGPTDSTAHGKGSRPPPRSPPPGGRPRGRATISGDSARIEVPDFVIPCDPPAAPFTVVTPTGTGFGVRRTEHTVPGGGHLHRIGGLRALSLPSRIVATPFVFLG